MVTPEVSVIIPVRNGAALIGKQLDALAAQDFDGGWEVIVVDNGSTDALADAVASFDDRVPGLRVVRADERVGVPYARNCGVRSSSADLIVLCDADDEVDPAWLTAMVAGLRRCDHVGGLVDELSINPPVVTQWRRPKRRDALQVALELHPYATGACCGVRREVFDAVGGWNEDYDRAANDVEFSFRIQLAGYHLCWVPEAVVHYRLRPTLRAHAGQSFRTGRSYAQLLRDFGRYGARDRRWRRRLRDWAQLIALAPAAVVREGPRGMWVGMVATEVGRACGWLVFRPHRRR